MDKISVSSIHHLVFVAFTCCLRFSSIFVLVVTQRLFKKRLLNIRLLLPLCRTGKQEEMIPLMAVYDCDWMHKNNLFLYFNFRTRTDFYDQKFDQRLTLAVVKMQQLMLNLFFYFKGKFHFFLAFVGTTSKLKAS